MLFYAPRWLWKSWEGGKIRALMMDLDVAVCTEIEKKTKKKLILDYLWENLRYHNWWAYRYYLCEALALVNVIGNYYLFLSNMKFWHYVARDTRHHSKRYTLLNQDFF